MKPTTPTKLSLPVVDEPIAPVQIEPVSITPAAAPNPHRPSVTEGDPFNPHKILKHFERVQAVARGENVYPITVEIDPINICNHRCGWCVSSASHTGEILSLQRFRELVDEVIDRDAKSVVIKGGGEPTVHPEINEMFRYLQEKNVPFGLITNGSMPRQATTDTILDTAEWVRVSLDAASAATHQTIHGTKDFSKIICNVQYLTSHATRTLIGLNFVAEPRNAMEIEPFARFGRDLGVAYVSIRCVFDPANPLPHRMRQIMREQAAAAKLLETGTFRVFLGNFTDAYLDADPNQPFPYNKCLGPNLVGVVGADGEMYACCFLRGEKKFSFGNVNEQSFEDIWNGEKRKDVMEQVYQGKCGRVCLGGMTANRYNRYNEILNYLALEEQQHANFV